VLSPVWRWDPEDQAGKWDIMKSEVTKLTFSGLLGKLGAKKNCMLFSIQRCKVHHIGIKNVNQ